MAKTTSNGAITQLTASGNSDAIDVSGGYALTVSVKHTNGTGTITAGATVQPQISHDGVNWFNDGGAFTFGTTASAVEYRTYVAPNEGFTLQKVRLVYTAPTGSTGHTLDAAYSQTTGV